MFESINANLKNVVEESKGWGHWESSNKQRDKAKLQKVRQLYTAVIST